MSNCKLNKSRGLINSEKKSKLHQELLKAFPGKIYENPVGGSLMYDMLFEDSFIEFYGKWYYDENTPEENKEWAEFYDKQKTKRKLFDDLGEPKLYKGNDSYYFVNEKGKRFYLSKKRLTRKDQIEVINSLSNKYLNSKKGDVAQFVKQELDKRVSEILEEYLKLEDYLKANIDTMPFDKAVIMTQDASALKQQLLTIQDDILDSKTTFDIIVKSIKGNLSPFSKKYLEEVEDKESDAGLEGNDDIKLFMIDKTEVRDTNYIDDEIIKIMSTIPLTKSDIKTGGQTIVRSNLLDLPLSKNINEVKNKIISIVSNSIEYELSQKDELVDPFDIMMDKLKEFSVENNDYVSGEFHNRVEKLIKSLKGRNIESFKNKFVKSFYLSQNMFVITEISKKDNKLIMRHIDPSSTQDKIALVGNNIIRDIFNKFKYNKRTGISEKDDLIKAEEDSIKISSKRELIKILKLLNITLSDEAINRIWSNKDNLLKYLKKENTSSKTLTLERLFSNLFTNPVSYQKEIDEEETKENDKKRQTVKGISKTIEAFYDATPFEQTSIYKEITNKDILTPISILAMFEAMSRDDISDSSLYVGSKQRWMYSTISAINKEILAWKAGNISSLLNKKDKGLLYVDYLLDLENVRNGLYDMNSPQNIDEIEARINNIDLIINSEIKTISDNNPVAHKEIGEVDFHMDIFFKMFNKNDEIYSESLDKQTNLQKKIRNESSKKNIYINNFSADKSSSYSIKGFNDLPANSSLTQDMKLRSIGFEAEQTFLRYLTGEYNSILKHSELIRQFIDTKRTNQQEFLMTRLIPEFHYVTKVSVNGNGYMKFNPETMTTTVYDSNDKKTSETEGMHPDFVNNAYWNKFNMLNVIYEENKEAFKVLFKNEGGFLLGKEDQQEALKKLNELTVKKVIEIAEKDKSYLDTLITKLDGDTEKHIFQQETNIIGSRNPEAVYDYIVNSMINNIEMFSLFNGEVGFYKQKSTSLSMEDALKRGPEIFTDGLYIRRPFDSKLVKSEYTTYNNKKVEVDKNKRAVVAVAHEIKNSKSKYENLINKAYGNKLNYGHELADAAGYITLDFYKRIKSGIYGWTDEDEKIFNRLNDKDYKFTDEDIKWLKLAGHSNAPLKLTFYKLEPIRDAKGNIIGEYPVYFKYSAAILAPAITNGSDLEKLKNKMEKNGVDQVVFKSGSKDANMTATTIHNSKDGLFDGLKDDLKLNPFTVDLSGLKLQVELPTKFDKEGTIGTQHTKNLLANLDLVSDEKNYVMKDHATGKEKLLSGKEILKEFEESANFILQDQLNKAIEDFGIKKDIRGYTFDQSKLRKIITSQLDITTEQDLIDVLSDTDLPIEAIPGVAQRIFPVIASYIHKNVGKLRTNTGSVVQMANIGYDRLSNKDSNNIIYLSDNTELKPPLPVTNENGDILYFNEQGNSSTEYKKGMKMRIDSAKVLMPFASIQKITGMSYNELKKAIEEGKIDKRIFNNIISYRIPNQSISSNDSMEIIGILPPTAGDSAVVYGEITAKTGSDFDIDKLYLMLPNFEYLKESGEIIYSDGNNIKGHQNKLIEVMKSILESHKTYNDLMSPLDDQVVNLKGTILKILYKKEVLKNPNLTYDEFLESRKKDPLSQMSAVGLVKARVSMLQAKKLVATMANHMTDIPMSQIIDQILKYDIGVGSSSFARQYMLGHEKDDEYKLTKVVSYFMNAAVDAAKDNYIIDGNFTSYTANAAMVMVRMGVTPENVFKILLNDDVLKLSNLKQLQVQKTTDLNLEDYSDENMKNLSIHFVNHLNKYGLNFNDFISRNDRLDSKLVLGFWNILQAAGKELNNELVIAKSDSNGAGSNIFEHQIQYNRLERLKKDSIGSVEKGNFVRGKKLFKNGIANHDLSFSDKLDVNELTFLGAMMNNSLFLTNLLTKNMFIENTDNYREIVNKITNQMGDELSVSEDNLKLVSKAIYPYILSKSGHRIYKFSRKEVEVLTGKDFLKVFQDMKAKYNNRFLDELYVDAVTNIISFKGSKFYDANSKMILKEAFTDLYNQAPEFTEFLIKYSFLTTGFKQTYFAFNEYMPIDFFIDSGHGQAMQNLIDTLNYESIYKDDAFIKEMMTFVAINNTSDYKIVRTISNQLDIKDNKPLTGTNIRKRLFNKKTKTFNRFVRQLKAKSKEDLYMLTDIQTHINKEKEEFLAPIYRKINSNINTVGRNKVRIYDFNTLNKEDLFIGEDKFASLELEPEKEYISELTKIFDINNWNVKTDSVSLANINNISKPIEETEGNDIEEQIGNPIEVKKDNDEEQNCDVPF